METERMIHVPTIATVWCLRYQNASKTLLFDLIAPVRFSGRAAFSAGRWNVVEDMRKVIFSHGPVSLARGNKGARFFPPISKRKKSQRALTVARFSWLHLSQTPPAWNCHVFYRLWKSLLTQCFLWRKVVELVTSTRGPKHLLLIKTPRESIGCVAVTFQAQTLF